MSKQKFKRGSFVQVSKEMPQNMSHFEKGFKAVVAYTYHQEFGYGSKKEYSLLQLSANDNPINQICWYEEPQLTQVEGTVKEGLALIEFYKYGE